MSDIDRYLTDEVLEEAAGAAFDDGFLRYAPEHIARWGEEDDEGVRESWRVVARAALSSALPGIIRQAKSEAMTEAADDMNARINAPNLIANADKWGGYYAGIRASIGMEEQRLRARADEIEAMTIDHRAALIGDDNE